MTNAAAEEVWVSEFATCYSVPRMRPLSASTSEAIA
jgi:hypothetical protein